MFWRVVRWSLLVLLLVVVGWGTYGYLQFRSAVQASNGQVPANVRAALSPTDGPALTTPSTILLMGSDTRKGYGQADDPGRSDSLILMRIDPSHHRVSMLSIPRDLRVQVPGWGERKVNNAYALGGPALTIKTVRALTGVPVNHYMLIDFGGFKELIDAIGGVDVVNPYAIRSNKFDGRVWRFKKGRIHLTGRRALRYARVRENVLNPGESDLTRAQRQQQVIQAMVGKLVGTHSLLHPGPVARAVMKPLVTDITAGQLLSFALVKAMSHGGVKCRLGGDVQMIDGSSYLVGGEDNRAVVRMFLGDQPPLKPDTRINLFAAGCTG